ncbi:MAG TPA: SDR family NAD(P)-dependent oxidoreductase, partial [Caulobacteraceae bacterium]|nr:SDR family NAD(P)-dependent oxidoreductase [Caulobacteraceae bacterium]
MFDLTGKTALVTGATGGIGAEIARKLHAQGAHVVLSGTREAVLQDLAQQLGERTSAVAANLSDPAAVDGLIDAAETAAGKPIDILVANAGITKDNLFVALKDEEWERVLDINLTSTFRLARAAV